MIRGVLRGVTTSNVQTVAPYASSLGNRLLFQSHLWDPDVDLYFMRARVFDPFREEFLQRDPSGYADSVNMYAGFAWDPVNLKDPTGRDVVLVAVGGGVGGDGSPVDFSAANDPRAQLIRELQGTAERMRVVLKSQLSYPGLTGNGSIGTGENFVTQNLRAGDRLVLYGYSRGGDAVSDLARKLQGRGIQVDLLVTVDAAFGPLSTGPCSVVDRAIPSNVRKNLNIFQVEPSGPSSTTRTGQALGVPGCGRGESSATNSGTFDSIGSRGAPNYAVDPSATEVENRLIEGVDHGTIDHRSIPLVRSAIMAEIYEDFANQVRKGASR